MSIPIIYISHHYSSIIGASTVVRNRIQIKRQFLNFSHQFDSDDDDNWSGDRDRHRPNRIMADYPYDHSRTSMASPVRLARNQAIAMVGMGPDVPEATYRLVQ